MRRYFSFLNFQEFNIEKNSPVNSTKKLLKLHHHINLNFIGTVMSWRELTPPITLTVLVLSSR